MTWAKPKKAWQWMVLFIPAGICVVATLAGGLIDPKEGNWMAWALIGLFIATLTSFGLSIWLARANKSIGAMLACTVVCFAILMVVNFAVSFAGCALGSTMLPGIDFK